MQQGAGDTFLALLCLEPKRCGKCLHRFFRFNRYAKYVLPLMICFVLGGLQLRREIRQYRIDQARANAVQTMAMPGGSSGNSPSTVPAKRDSRPGR